jgi:hypothetical protein
MNPGVAVSALEQLPLDEVLEHVNVPSYIIDAGGVVRWLNRAALNVVGDVHGRQFTSVVTPEDTLRARELFARKVVGTAPVTDARVVVVGADGRPRARPLDGRDRRRVAAEHGDGAQPHPAPPARGRRPLAAGGGCDRKSHALMRPHC